MNDEKTDMEANRKYQILSGNQIRYILIFAMLIDHIAWAFVPKSSSQGQIMHFFGRLTGPGMAFFLTEGFLHTKNLKAYLKRLGIFAFISWPAFVFFEKGSVLPIRLLDGRAEKIKAVLNVYLPFADKTFRFYPQFGMIYSLFLALLLLTVYVNPDLDPMQKERRMFLLMLLSLFGDWAGFAQAFALLFLIFRSDTKMKWLSYSLVGLLSFSINGLKPSGLFQAGIYLVPLLLSTYNGKRGSYHPFHKWFFYVFYPLHLWVIGYFRWRDKLPEGDIANGIIGLLLILAVAFAMSKILSGKRKGKDCEGCSYREKCDKAGCSMQEGIEKEE